MLVPTRREGVCTFAAEKRDEVAMEQEASVRAVSTEAKGGKDAGKGREVRLPVYSTRMTSPNNGLFLTIPPLISGALICAFARHIATLLGDPLLTNFYLTDQRVAINLDRILDRLITAFTKELWDELLQHFTAMAGGCTGEVMALFEGPMRQLTLILNGPETAKCLLDLCAPGLSKRPGTWTQEGRNENGRADLRVDLELALRLTFGWINRQSKQGEVSLPAQNVSNSLHECLTNSKATKKLLHTIRQHLMTPHYISLYQLESAVWEAITKRRRSTPGDGFHVAQFRIQCLLCPSAILDSRGFRDRIVVTGTKDECRTSTIGQYIGEQFPRCGKTVLQCLEEALQAAQAAGSPTYGSSTYDMAFHPEAEVAGVKTILLELFEHSLQISVYARPFALIEVLQNVSWLCAALGDQETAIRALTVNGETMPHCSQASNIEQVISITDSGSDPEALFVEAKIMSQDVGEGEGMDCLKGLTGVKVARGFPPIGLAKGCGNGN